MKLESCGRAADISCYGDGCHRWNHGVIARSGEIVRIDIMAPDPHHFIVLWDGHREVNVDGPGMKFIPSATRRVELSPRKRKDPDSMLISVGDWKLIPDRPALEVLAEVAVNDRLPHCEGTRGPLEKPERRRMGNMLKRSWDRGKSGRKLTSGKSKTRDKCFLQ